MKDTDWLVIHFNLDESQHRRFDALMTTSMSSWPSALYQFCYRHSQSGGVSGDMLADTVATWIANGEPQEIEAVVKK